MIRNEAEYKEAVQRLTDEKKRMDEHLARLQESGLGEEEIKRVMDPMRAFHEQFKEEVTSYQRLKRGDFDELINLSGFGTLLVALRIAQGISQRDLASRLEVHESQISRDERNEYHNITIDRAHKILEALGVRIKTQVEFVPPSKETADI